MILKHQQLRWNVNFGFSGDGMINGIDVNFAQCNTIPRFVG